MGLVPEPTVPTSTGAVNAPAPYRSPPRTSQDLRIAKTGQRKPTCPEKRTRCPEFLRAALDRPGVRLSFWRKAYEARGTFHGVWRKKFLPGLLGNGGRFQFGGITGRRMGLLHAVTSAGTHVVFLQILSYEFDGDRAPT